MFFGIFSKVSIGGDAFKAGRKPPEPELSFSGAKVGAAFKWAPSRDQDGSWRVALDGL